MVSILKTDKIQASHGSTIEIPSGSVLHAPGHVLQVVTASTTTEVSTTSTSFSETGLTATITPTSTSNKVLIIFTVQRFLNVAAGFGNLKLVRDSTDLQTYGFAHYAGGSTDMGSASYQHLDSPSTTSATTYKIQFNNKTSGTIFCQYDDVNGEGISTILLMEIAG